MQETNVAPSAFFEAPGNARKKPAASKKAQRQVLTKSRSGSFWRLSMAHAVCCADGRPVPSQAIAMGSVSKSVHKAAQAARRAGPNCSMKTNRCCQMDFLGGTIMERALCDSEVFQPFTLPSARTCLDMPFGTKPMLFHWISTTCRFEMLCNPGITPREVQPKRTSATATTDALRSPRTHRAPFLP